MSFRASSQILPWLYLGNDINARQDDVLTERNVGRVLCVKDSSRVYVGPRRWLHVPMSDHGDTPLDVVLPKIMWFLANSRRAAADGIATLVHCSQGVNRSTTCVLLWLLVGEGMTLCEAWAHVHQKHSIALPHEHYLHKLAEVEVALYETSSRGSVAGYVPLAAILRRCGVATGQIDGSRTGVTDGEPPEVPPRWTAEDDAVASEAAARALADAEVIVSPALRSAVELSLDIVGRIHRGEDVPEPPTPTGAQLCVAGSFRGGATPTRRLPSKATDVDQKPEEGKVQTWHGVAGGGAAAAEFPSSSRARTFSGRKTPAGAFPEADVPVLEGVSDDSDSD